MEQSHSAIPPQLYSKRIDYFTDLDEIASRKFNILKYQKKSTYLKKEGSWLCSRNKHFINLDKAVGVCSSEIRANKYLTRIPYMYNFGGNTSRVIIMTLNEGIVL